MKALIQKIKRLLRDRRFRRLWSRTISVVAALVVFVTTYALVLPAITMEREAYCGIPAHQHTDACFEQRLICTIPESPGHRHDEGCYTTHQELDCQIEEHTHDPTACYDEEGTLVCQLPEHVHDQTVCWKDVTELTCTVEESDGHQHSDACYENVLVCGMEVHTHSEECYHNPDEDAEANAVAAMQDGGDGTGAETPDEGVVFETYEDFAGDEIYESSDPNGEEGLPADDGTGIPYDEPILNDEALLNEEGLPGGEGLPSDEGMEGMAAGQEIEGIEDGMPADGEGTTNGEDGMPEQGTDGNPDAAVDENGNPIAGTQTDTDENGNPILDPNAPQETAETTDTEQVATGGQLDPAANTYVPNLAPIDFAAALNKRTGIYYYAVQEGETVEDSSSIADWKKIEKNTELGPNDLLRVYLAYTIPAGSLNKTNPTAVYRLPVGLRLTDAQVNAINAVENGIAAQYIDYNTLTLIDPDNYHRYLGAEAIEGTRKPDQDLNEYLKEHTADGGEAQEFISATVRVENVYGTESSSGDGDSLLCQNLIFTFSPYTIEKNQHTYDASGQPTRAGEKVRGWFTLDFNLAQVNLGEPRLEETSDAAAANPVNAENAADGAAGATDAAVGTAAVMARVIRTAEIVFVQEDQSRGLEEISTQITVVTEEEMVNTGENSEVGNDYPAETDEADENNENHENDENIEETAENEETEKTAAERNNADEPDVNTAEAEAKKEKTDEEKEAELKEAMASMMPAISFEDSIRVRTGKPAGVVEGDSGAVAANAAEALPRKAKVTVRVEADEGTFPVGTTMVLSAVEDLDAVAEMVRDAVENGAAGEAPENGEATDAGSDHTTGNAEKTNPANDANASNNPKTYGFQAVDISFRDADGNEIEPAKPVRVALTSEIVEQIKKDKEADGTTAIADPVVVHVDDKGNAEKMDLIAPEEIEPAQGRTEEEIREELEKAAAEEAVKQEDEEKEVVERDGTEEVTTSEEQVGGDEDAENGVPEEEHQTQDPAPSGESSVFFEAESFSIYAIVYTVDFHYHVDGETYDLSIPGGGFISLEHLVETLGIGKAKASSAESEDSSVFFSDENAAAEESVEAVDINSENTSDWTKKFVAEVSDVRFSDDSLMWVGKVNADTTIGALKNANDLACEYSAELTEEQIAEIDAQEVKAGDWALISRKPFESEETLTVTMKNGDVWTVEVTDAQISTNVLTADGKTYKITVTFDDDAEIPAGTKLVVREIEPDTDEFMEHLAQAWSEVNKEYLEQEALMNSHPDGVDYDKGIRPVNLDDARFFNITLLYNGEPIEPKTPVQVDIQYIEGLKSETDEMVSGVVHFKENADEEESIELIDKVETRTDDDGGLVEFSYEQDSFSDVGTYVGRETKDGGPLSFTPSIDLQLFGAQKAGTGLGIPSAEKNLDPNEDEDGHPDGTYTLSLSVTGQAIESSSLTKANVLFIMDRSSSMTGNVYERYEGQPAGETYYRQNELGNFVALRTYNGRYYYANTWTEYTGPVFIKTSTTRLAAEQKAMRTLIGSLLKKNVDHPGTVDISIISFADTRGDRETTTTSGGTWNTSVTETAWNHDSATLLNAVNATEMHSGTNWEEALLYAQEKIGELPADRKDEKTYVIFLTDGEPTAIHEETGGAHHYDNDQGQKIYGGFDYAYGPACDDARDIVEAGYSFYTVMTFNPLISANKYLKRLTNYAYDYDGDGVGGDSIDTGDDVDTDGSILQNYYFNASTPEEMTSAFESIFKAVSNSIAHGQVKITDGMTAGAMTSTFVSGSPSGVRYIVSKNDVEQYSVTVENNADDEDNPIVTFHINGEDYSTTDTGARQVTKVTNPDTAYDKGTYYTVTVGDVEYKMALASIVKKTDTEDTLTWDLTPIGTLWGDCTYTAEFVVWPNQDAYDYVAALNNGLKQIKNSKNETVNVKWDQSTAVPVRDPVTNEITYYMGGCAGYPSVVYYPGAGDDYAKGIYNGVFAVLTNTEQYLDYSVVTKENGEVTGIVPQDQIPLETPKPMKLTAAGSRVSKLWNISRDPDALLRLLYEFDGEMPRVDENNNPIPKQYEIPVLDPETGKPAIDEETGKPKTKTVKGFFIDFSIMQDANAEPYKTVRLGWDETQNKYVWYEGDEESQEQYVKTKTYGTGENAVTLTYGTRWEQDFSIATGLMVTRDRLEELHLDPDNYAHGKYPNNDTGTVYYLLEDGHDYTLSEPELGYEFDFDAPTYHPMLVNGVMKSVRFTKDTENKTISISEIEDLKISSDGASLLEIINTLRGYIHVKKVVAADGVQDTSYDETKFTYDVNLYNDDGAFITDGSHIPWYGIDGLFYRTIVQNEEGEDDYQYYQAVALGTETGENGATIGILSLTDEHGNTYRATCAGAFDENAVGPTDVTFEVNGTPKTIPLYGNQMEYSDPIMTTDPETGEPKESDSYRKVHATFMINQKQQLNIANVPVSTKYEVVERTERGYEFVRVESTAAADKDGTGITGIIVPNSDTEITYTNKAVTGDLNLKKLVTINEFAPSNDAVTDKTLADGEYTFHIDGKAETDTASESYTVKITISQGEAVSAKIQDNTAETPAFSDVDLINGAVPIHNLTPGVYVISEDASLKTLCTAINSTNTANQTDLDNRVIEVVVRPGTSEANLVTFINNYAEEGVTDIAHISVRKTFDGLTKDQLPAGFHINVSVNYTVRENGQNVAKTASYELTGASDTDHGVLWKETVNDNGVVWDWTIAIKGITPDAVVNVQEVNYKKPGYYVTTSGNPTNGDAGSSDVTSYSGSVVPSTTIARLEEVITEQNSKVYPVEDKDDEATIFIARLVPSQTALVISKKRLNLNERASLEEMLRHMPNAQDWYNGQQPQYFSFEQAANNEITVRSNFHVTYFEENGHGYFRFEDKKIWNMVATRKIIYKEGRPADFNFVNSYTELPVNVDVIKIDREDDSKKLGGAVFTLRKLTELNGNPPAPTGNGTFDGTQMAAHKPAETADDTGKATFEGLTQGYYELTETKVPDGYIKTENNPVYFRIKDGAVTWIEWSAEEEQWIQRTKDPNDNTVTFEKEKAAVQDNPLTDENVAQEATNAAFIIGNTPGSPLPSSGGPGSRFILLLGGALALTAGGLLILRVRRKYF